MLYLMMALAWLVLGVAAFVMPRFNQVVGPWKIPGTDISTGWLALFFVVYNLTRWWTVRPRERDRRILRPTPARPLTSEPPLESDSTFRESPRD